MSTPSQTPLHPRIKWCEREDKVYLTIELPDAREVEVTIDAETFEFSAKDASGRAYAETLRLYKPVKKDESTYATTERQVFCALVKEDADWWERLLAAGEKKPANLHVDFDKWADEDDDAGEGELEEETGDDFVEHLLVDEPGAGAADTTGDAAPTERTPGGSQKTSRRGGRRPQNNRQRNRNAGRGRGRGKKN